MTRRHSDDCLHQYFILKCPNDDSLSREEEEEERKGSSE